MITSPEKQVLKSKICCSCGFEKHITSFYKNAYVPTGYEARCKTCKNNKQRCRAEKNYDRSKNLSSGRPRQDAPQLWNVRKQDWVETFMFLKSIGYNLSGDKTIHEQFCDKHNIEPKKRTYEKSIQYTPQDLGLI